MEKFGINGFAEEVMEEEIGIPLHALLDGEGKVSDLLDAKQQLDIIGGMAISVGSMYAMCAGSRPVKGIYNRAQPWQPPVSSGLPSLSSAASLQENKDSPPRYHQ
jgi:hypothetical protein